MNGYLTILSELLLPLLHLLIIHKFLKVFLGTGKRSLISCIEWSVYYVFLLINNIGIVFRGFVHDCG